MTACLEFEAGGKLTLRRVKREVGGEGGEA